MVLLFVRAVLNITVLTVVLTMCADDSCKDTYRTILQHLANPHEHLADVISRKASTILH